jgi:hypothetical protein
MLQKIKKIADQIIKFAAPQKHVLTLQFDRNSVKILEKTLGTINGFGDVSSDKIRFQIPITINPDVINVVDFETQLTNILRRKSLTNVKLVLEKSVGRPTRVLKPTR